MSMDALASLPLDLRAIPSPIVEAMSQLALRSSGGSSSDDSLPNGTTHLGAPSRLEPGFNGLFDYQEEVAREVVEAYVVGMGVLVAMPTGAGKTRTAIAAALRILQVGGARRCLWLAPSRELVTQAISTLRTLWPFCGFGFALDVNTFSSTSTQASFDFMTIQMARESDLIADGRYDVVVIDEAHQAAAVTYDRVISLSKQRGAFLIGLSATPSRQSIDENVDLARIFCNRLIVSRKLGDSPVRELRSRGVLSNLEIIECPNLADFTLNILDLIGRVVSDDPSASGIGFCRSVAESRAVSLLFCAYGVPSLDISHFDSPHMRQSKLRAIAAGSAKWIFNSKLLATGFDLPALSRLALLGSIDSEILYEQILGRVSRGPSVGGTARSCVFDFFGHVARFGDAQSYARFSDYNWRPRVE